LVLCWSNLGHDRNGFGMDTAFLREAMDWEFTFGWFTSIRATFQSIPTGMAW
jgi:hypothetical protein